MSQCRDTVSKIGMYGWTRGARFSGGSQGQSDERVGQFVAKERDFIFKASNLARSLGTVDYFTGFKGNGA